MSLSPHKELVLKQYFEHRFSNFNFLTLLCLYQKTFFQISVSVTLINFIYPLIIFLNIHTISDFLTFILAPRALLYNSKILNISTTKKTFNHKLILLYHLHVKKSVLSEKEIFIPLK